MKKTIWAIAGILLLAPAALSLAQKTGSAPADAPLPGFEKMSGYVKQHDIPGIGDTYVDPKTLPTGPFLGYDVSGNMTSVSYLLPLAQLDEHRDFRDLGHGLSGVKIDHTDVTYSASGQGMSEPHYVVSEWLVPSDQVLARHDKTDAPK